jgi:hypothetical protein
MSFRKFALKFALGLGFTGLIVVSAASNSVPPAAPGNEGQQAPATGPKASTQPHRASLSDICQRATWPYIPAECLRSADPGRQSRPVRIIPIHEISVRS